MRGFHRVSWQVRGASSNIIKHFLLLLYIYIVEMDADLFKQITQRILEYAQAVGLQDQDLASALGIKRQNITPMKSGATYISPNRLIPFLCSHRKRLNMVWAMTGEGNMLADPVNNAKLKVDRKGNITFRGNGHTEVDQVEIQRLGELLESKEQHIKSLNELVRVYKGIAERNSPDVF